MLFNKEEGLGQREFKSILGFNYASMPFDNLKTDIILVEDDIKNLIGAQFFAAIQAFYLSDDYEAVVVPPVDPDLPVDLSPIYTELVHRLQAAIAFYAYRSYATQIDLDHSETGRKIISTETQKPAFEWMIERDDQSILSKAHRLTDRMLQYIDEQKEAIIELFDFTNTDEYKALKSLCISSCDQFDEIFPIGRSRRFFLKVLPFIREIENTRIRSILGTADYMVLKANMESGQMDEDNQVLLGLIRGPLALLTMVMACKRLNMDILPEGIFQNYMSQSQTMKATQPAPVVFLRMISQSLEEEAQRGLLALQEYLSQKLADLNQLPFEPQNLLNRNDAENKHFRV